MTIMFEPRMKYFVKVNSREVPFAFSHNLGKARRYAKYLKRKYRQIEVRVRGKKPVIYLL